jgi:SH3 domain-containing protein
VGVSLRTGVVAALALAAASAGAGPSEDRFREANDLVRAGDYPRAVAIYGELARGGAESATLYWNWAQAASARGAHGEALWALLRARELDPGDRAVARDVDRLREALNLDRAEIAPEPLAVAGRFSRRFRLDLVALGLLALSLLVHAASRLGALPRNALRLAGAALVLALAAASVPLAASQARPTAAVVRRGAPLLDAASPSADTAGTLREGEVVPVLDSSGDWLQVEDNAGARGWVHESDVRRLDRAPGKASLG